MCRKGNSVLRYIFAYFLCLTCLFALFPTEIYGYTTARHSDRGVTSAYKGDISSRHQQRNPAESHSRSNGDTLAPNSQTDIDSRYQTSAKGNAEIHEDPMFPNGKPDTNPRKQKPAGSHTGSNGDALANSHQSDINSHIQKPEKGSGKTHGDALTPNGESETNPHLQNHTTTNGDTLPPNGSHAQERVKSSTEIHGDRLAPNGEPDTNGQKQKPAKDNTDGDTLSVKAERDPHSKLQEQPIEIRTKSYPTPTSVSRRRAKRLKTRSLMLLGEISLSDIPVLELSTSAPPVSPSSTISNRTLSDALTRAASNGSGVTRETVPADFTAISVVPSEEAFPKELPLPLLIASPVAAVSIIIFVCVAYCCHSNQLDARARQLALKYAVISTEPPACSRGIPSTSSVDMDLIRKTSLRPSTSRTSTPNPTPNGSKRGSMNWVAIGDQEVITYTAARRHSTFIL